MRLSLITRYIWLHKCNSNVFTHTGYPHLNVAKPQFQIGKGLVLSPIFQLPSPSLNIGQSMLGMLGPNVQLEMGWLKLESNVNEISNLIYGIGWSYTPWGLSHQSWALDVVASNNQEKYLSDCKVAVNQDKQLLLSRQ